MRLTINDTVRLMIEGILQTMRIAKISGNGQVFMVNTSEANVDARDRNKDDPFKYVSKTSGSLYNAQARKITISPIGELRDSGFRR